MVSIPDPIVVAPPARAFATPRESHEALLALLDAAIPFDLWAVSRVTGEDWVVLQARDHGYGVSAGARQPWGDTLCAAMAAGEAPAHAPDVDAVRAYRDAPIRGRVPIGAYLGAPLRLPDGTLFGTLCAIAREPRSPVPLTEAQRRLLDTVARTLATLAHLQLSLDATMRRADRALEDAARDPLTGVANRRGWHRAVVDEQARIDGLAGQAAVIYVDLDDLKRINDARGHDAGDRALIDTARLLREHCRQVDTVARMGGDEFAVLMPECDATGLARAIERVRAALAEAGIAASVAGCGCAETGSLEAALAEADARMYRAKAARKAPAGAGGDDFVI